MEELEKNINEIMNRLNQEWVNCIKEAEKNDEGIDLSVMFSKYSELVQRKDQAFQDAKIRKTKKKGGFFG